MENVNFVQWLERHGAVCVEKPVADTKEEFEKYGRCSEYADHVKYCKWLIAHPCISSSTARRIWERAGLDGYWDGWHLEMARENITCSGDERPCKHDPAQGCCFF